MGFFKNPSILPRDRERARGEMCLHILFFISTGQKKMLDFYSTRNLDAMLLGEPPHGRALSRPLSPREAFLC